MSDKKDDLTPNEVATAISELRSEVEKGSAADQGKITKLNEALDAHEEKQTQLVKDVEASKAAEADLKERVKFLEKMATKGSNGKTDGQAKEEARKAYDNFLRNGEDKLSEAECKYLRTDNATDGGVLAPAETLNEIIKPITEISAMRSICRVRTAGAGRMEIPVRNTLVSSFWEGEGEPTQDSNSKYGIEKLPLNKIMTNVPITIEELEDSEFDMEAEINSDVGESFAQKEGQAFVAGDGFKKPEGFTANAALIAAARNTGAAADLTMDSILLLASDLKTGYNPLYVMNRRTIGQVRILKDSEGQYLWQQGNIAAGVPNQLNGFPYLELPDMDDVGADAFPIAFGDFRRGYMIGDSLRMDVIRDPFTLKKEGKVEFTFIRRTGGHVVNAEAIKLLKVST